MVSDEVFEGDEAKNTVRRSGELHESWKNRGDLYSREVFIGRLRVSNANRQVERQPGNVGERMRGVDGEWGEHGEDRRIKQFVSLGPINVTQRIHFDERNSGLGKERQEGFLRKLSVPHLKIVSFRVNVGENAGRSHAGVCDNGNSGFNSTLETSNANHEEFIEIVREDCEEVDSFKQRNSVVFG